MDDDETRNNSNQDAQTQNNEPTPDLVEDEDGVIREIDPDEGE